MNKKLKKMLAIISAVAVCAVSAMPFSVSASDNPVYDKIIKSFEEKGAFLDVYGDDTFVVTEDEALLLTEGNSTSITVKKKVVLPIDEINEKIYPAEVYRSNIDLTNPDAEIHYGIWFNNAIKEEVVDIVSAYDDVLSIDTKYDVRNNNTWWCYGVYFKTDLDCDELFPDYNIIDSADVESDFMFVDKSGRLDGYKYIEFSDRQELYPVLKKIQDNNIEYELFMVVGMPVPPVYATETVNLYKSDDFDSYFMDNISINIPEKTLAGDANEDGKVSLADAVLIMQALSNPDEYKLTPQGMANADIAGDGDGVTAMDALRIQEIELGIE